MVKYNYIDLFHGIGGFALGAYNAGMKFENHFCSDIEKYPQELYKLRFPDSIQLGDITKIDTKELKKYGNNWIISGGFPCQDISIAGKGVGINGERSALWFEYWRIISDLRPKFAIMENVSALTFRGLAEVLGSLTEIGYNAEWQDIRAADMGAPHKRERIWIVAYPFDSSDRTNRKESGEKKKIQGEHRETGRSRMSCGTDSKIPNPCFINVQGEQQKFNDPEEREKQKERQVRFCSRARIWETEPNVGRLANGLSGRVDRLKGLGNAIVPQIAELLFKQIKDQM